MKTKPMSHQEVGLQLLRENAAFMLACEMGTGKSWMLMADAEERFLKNEIDAFFIVAPNGVHTNWTQRELPKHMSVPYVAAFYRSGASKRHNRTIEALFGTDCFEERTLRILSMNIEALNTKAGFDLAMKFVRRFRCCMAVDESHRIKNPDSGCTKKALLLAEHAVVRRAATGTPIANAPEDAFSQFEFLGSGLLGTTSYRAFVARYTQLMPPSNRFIIDIIAKRQPGLVGQYRAALAANDQPTANAVMAKLTRFAPQIATKDINGRPVYRNLDDLRLRMAPHTYRVTKKECLDLPDKLYQTRYFELTAAQRRMYDTINELHRFEDEEGNVSIFNALTKLTKLQQVTSGFLMVDGEARALIDDGGPRMTTLLELTEEIEGQFIVWAAFTEEIEAIERNFKKKGINCVTYYGETKKSDRELAVDKFQAGEAKAFIGIAAAGGTGLTLTAATTAIYYSNTLKLVERLQSEDRCHRIGTESHVLYVDLAAIDTRDEDITAALQHKQDVAAYIVGDRNSEIRI